MAKLLDNVAGWLWGMPLLYIVLGGGFFFTVYSRMVPFLYLRHSFEILLGRYDSRRDPGEISHFQALCSALSGTVGMGNISGVAIAVTEGGPGALFWMWVCALVGMATKFFTCTLAVMYRGRDDQGQVQGGPMYYIVEGLGPNWKPLASSFCLFGLFGALPLFQSNQLTGIVRKIFLEPNDFLNVSANPALGNGFIGVVMTLVVGLVIVGGIRRIGRVASVLVPLMVLIYGGAALFILLGNVGAIPGAFTLIFTDAFSGDAVAGGVLGTVIATGVRRAAFSNEAGMGTEAMAHGAARTGEPVREGLVAMLGPMIDTLIVCTLTGLVILVTGVWQEGGEDGVLLTTAAFSSGLGAFGPYVLLVCVLFFSFSSMIGYSYYVTKCATFLFGSCVRLPALIFYLVAILVSAFVSLDNVINFMDIMFGMMAVPTILSTILLAPRVMKAFHEYVERQGLRKN